MRKGIIFSALLLIMFLAACSKDDGITPNERFDAYIDLWQDEDFKAMYDMLATDSTDAYPTEEFIDRYQKIYDDLNVSNLKINFKKLDDDELNEAYENGTATIPFSVDMDTIAGEIDFDYEATIVQEGEEEEKDWFIQWDPGFIFPELKDGGEIHLETTEARRGEILDRNRMPLAINDTVYEIGIIPEELGNNPEQAIEQLAGYLDLDPDSIQKKLDEDWVEPDLFVPIKKVPVDAENLEAIMQIDGVMRNETTGRVYPLGKAAAHLVGYVGPVSAEDLKEHDDGAYTANDVIGKRGLEQLYEEELRGEPGYKITVEKEGEEQAVLAEKPVEDGENIVLTIDADVQEEIYASYDGDAGTAASINPKTGETLALVSSPAFDPNEMAYGISNARLQEMEKDPQTPLINRFSATFSPGSTFKPIVAAIGMANGNLDPDEGIEIKGKTWSNGEGWGDYKVRRVSETNKPVDLTDALRLSDNIYFAMQAVDMGGEAMVSGLEQFGFGEELPFAYPIETSTISNDGTLDDEILRANTGYGQGELQISALHLALAYTPFLNDGTMLQPTLLKNEETNQAWKSDLISSDEAKRFQDDLRKVVTEGTAKAGNQADVPVSGKTGTAELKLSNDDESGQENGWFVGYPTEDKDILIAMMIEHTEDKGGSSYTVEKVTSILDELK